MIRPPSRLPAITVGAQAAWLKRRYPDGRVVQRRDRVVWLGTVAPSEYSRRYRLLLDDQRGKSPLIYVPEPRLRLYKDQPLEHVYTLNTLCLYLDSEWQPTVPLAHTVVPWAIEWLHFYELWSVSGVWEGKGEHPDAGAASRAARRQSDSDLRDKKQRLKSALQLAYGSGCDLDELLFNAHLKPSTSGEAA